MTGFFNGKGARIFMGELWALLKSAQDSGCGIPAEMMEAKKEAIRQRKVSLFTFVFIFFLACFIFVLACLMKMRILIFI